MSGYLVFNFPKTRFVAENTLGQQIDHIMSEVEEVVAAAEISNEAVEEEPETDTTPWLCPSLVP